MKIIISTIVAFATGIAAGFLTARKLLTEKYALYAENEIESVKDFYNRREQMKVPETIIKADMEGFRKGVSEASAAAQSLGAVLSRSSLEGTKTNEYNATKRNYNLIRPGEIDDSQIEPEGEPDSEEEDPVENPETDDAVVMGTPPAPNLLPYQISDSDFVDSHADDYTKISLCYYKKDNVLCEEDGESTIDNPEDVIGPEILTLLKHSKKIILWVRNEGLEADYEIVSVNKAYADGLNGGEAPNEPKSRPKKRRTSED